MDQKFSHSPMIINEDISLLVTSAKWSLSAFSGVEAGAGGSVCLGGLAFISWLLPEFEK